MPARPIQACMLKKQQQNESWPLKVNLPFIIMSLSGPKSCADKCVNVS